MRLIIAEKPSVAKSIAAVLNVTEKKDGYLEGNNDIISWCVGHLVQLAPTEEYNSNYKKWNFNDLPIIPNIWRFSVLSDTKKQYKVLADFMKNEKVQEIVCATDAGREGELIFRLVYYQCGCKKPVKRLWISSMEEKAILNGLQSMKNFSEYDCLYHAALCRAKADWLVGINFTRLFSLAAGKVVNVGRVVTPTLSFLVERKKEITEFKKEKYYTIQLNCKNFFASSDKLSDKAIAEKIKNACTGKSAVLEKIEEKERKENPPKLYDLTSLQRDANRIYGYTAQQTLDYLQSLYEQKLATYPRTDSRYLTEDMKDNAVLLAEGIKTFLSFAKDLLIPINIEQVIDNSKVTDHHAVIPTQTAINADISKLPTGEYNIFILLCVRLLCAVGEANSISETTVTVTCEDYTFTAKGKATKIEGWKEIEKGYLSTLKQKKENDTVQSLPALEQGQKIDSVSAEIKEGTTTPPKHFTEDTLLSAMENASAKDFSEIPNIEHKGLGTPATRASMIEKLIKTGLAERKTVGKSKEKYLIPTEKGIDIIGCVPKEITSAKMTAEWETALKEIETKHLPQNTFMANIENFVSDIIQKHEKKKPQREVIGKCPFCGKNIHENSKSYYCAGYQDTPKCEFNIWKNNNFFAAIHKPLTKEIVKELLEKGQVQMTALFSEKTKKKYDATVVLASVDEQGRKKVKFKLDFSKNDNKKA